MKNRVFLAAVCAVGLTANAVNYCTFPNSDESFDLASVEAWGGNFPYNSSDYVVLKNSDAVYGVSSNVTFSAIDFWASRMTIDLSSTPERTVSIRSSDSAFYPYSDGASINLKGGIYYFQNYGKLVASSHDSFDKSTSTSITLSDGVIVTNSGVVYGKYATNGRTDRH